MNFCNYPSSSKSNVQTPYEKRLFSNVNGGAPLSCPRWEATGEYHASSTFDPSTNTWKNSEEEVVVKYSYYLVKGSKFKNNDSNEVSTLHEDVGIKINGRMKVKYGDSYFIIGTNTKDSVEVVSPIISVGGFGVKTNGTYNITLVEESKVKVSSNERITLFGPLRNDGPTNGETQTYLKIRLEEDMTSTYVSNLPLDENKKVDDVKDLETKPIENKVPQIIPNIWTTYKPFGISLHGKKHELIRSFESILDLIDTVDSKVNNVEFKVNNVESKVRNSSDSTNEMQNNIEKILDRKLNERELDDVKNKLKTLETIEEKLNNLSKPENEVSKDNVPAGSVVEEIKDKMEYFSAEELREKIKETEPLNTASTKVVLSKELLAKLQS
jgi:hypothetical protein